MEVSKQKTERHYLVINEELVITTHTGTEPPEGVIDDCDNGICDLIDITHPAKPMTYMAGGWHSIDEGECDGSE